MMRILMLVVHVLFGRHSWQEVQRAQEELRLAQVALQAAQEKYSREALRQLMARQRRETRRDDD